VAARSIRARDRASSFWMSLRLLPRADVFGILLAMVVLVVAACGWWLAPASIKKTNFGFGPEWDCASPGKGGPICVKH
jgi:hypothetical protein